jgi:hypothetical protein
MQRESLSFIQAAIAVASACEDLNLQLSKDSVQRCTQAGHLMTTSVLG